MNTDTLEDTEIKAIEDLEGLIHRVVVGAGLEVHLALSAVTSILAQMIAALPDGGREQAVKTARSGIMIGVEIYKEIPEQNHFVTTNERRLDA